MTGSQQINGAIPGETVTGTKVVDPTRVASPGRDNHRRCRHPIEEGMKQ